MNADAFRVDVGLVAEVLPEVDEVLGFELTQFLISAVLKHPAALRGAARIDAGHDVALLGEQLMPVVVGTAPTVGYGINTRPSVDRDVNGVGLALVKTGWLDHPSVEVNTGIVGEGEKLLGLKVVLR